MKNFSIFETVMLIMFGLSWPIAIIKTLKSKTVKGITPIFYWFVFTGYLSGLIHKILYSKDIVILLYIFNLMTVGTQTVLYYYYKNKNI